MVKINPQVKSNTRDFVRLINVIVVSAKEAVVENKKPNLNNTYVKEFYSGYMAWNENLLIGGGVDSFYINCAKTVFTCASHPHNYYLEILSELGILGFILIMVLKLYLRLNIKFSYLGSYLKLLLLFTKTRSALTQLTNL